MGLPPALNVDHFIAPLWLREIVPSRPFYLKVLSVHRDKFDYNSCSVCEPCITGRVTTFHLYYFVYYGLDVSTVRAIPSPLSNYFNRWVDQKNQFSLKITWKLVAQAFEIMERRVRTVHTTVPSLLSLSGAVIIQSCSCFEKLPLPIKLKTLLSDCRFAFDVFERQTSQLSGNTIFRSWIFPRFLFNHKGQYLHF